MAEKLKWADVAHYYAFSNVYGEMNWGIAAIFHTPLEKPQRAQLTLELARLIQLQEISFVPILRHLEDMTESEAREWFKAEEGIDWPDEGYMEHRTALERWKFFMEVMWTSQGQWRPVFSPAEFVWLCKNGFNVFGLEWGTEAIRKEAGI